MDKIESYFEISTTINYINEIEKLKRIFLTPDQLTLFHLGMESELCLYNGDNLENKEQDESIHSFSKYLKELKHGKFETETDKRLFSTLNNNIKNII